MEKAQNFTGENRDTVEGRNIAEKVFEKKPESHEGLTQRLKNNLEQSKSLKEKINTDANQLNKLRETLGLGQVDDTPSLAASKERLGKLNKEYSEMHNTILDDETYSIDNLDGVFQDETHMGHKIASKNNLVWEKSSRNMQNSWEKQDHTMSDITRKLATNTEGMKDITRNKAEPFGDRKSFDEQRKDDDKKAKETDEYFASGEHLKQYNKTQEEIDLEKNINDTFDPDGSHKKNKEEFLNIVDSPEFKTFAKENPNYDLESLRSVESKNTRDQRSELVKNFNNWKIEKSQV